MAGIPGKSAAVIAAEMEANLAQIEALANGLSIAQFNWSPEPGRWSIGQNLAHLITVNGPDVVSLRRAVDAGWAEGMISKGPFYYSLPVRQFVASQEPPVKRKFSAPGNLCPPTEVEPGATLAEYQRISADLQRLARDADGLHLDVVKVEMSALPAMLRPFIRMPLGGRFELLNAHDRRHIVQAGEIRRNPRFPSL